jgi:hypothetical protein
MKQRGILRPEPERPSSAAPPRARFWSVADGALSIRLPLSAPSSSRAAVTAIGVKQQQRPAASRGSIRQTAVVPADDRFDRGDGPERACASATEEQLDAMLIGVGVGGEYSVAAIPPMISGLRSSG